MKLKVGTLRKLIREEMFKLHQRPPSRLVAGDAFTIPHPGGDVKVQVTKIELYGLHMRPEDPTVRIHYTYDGPGVGQGESTGSLVDFVGLWDA